MVTNASTRTASVGSIALTAEWIRDPRQWRELRHVWDEVVERSLQPSIFCSWDFLETSWIHFAEPSGSRLAVVMLQDGGRAVGFAPLRVSGRRRFGLPVRRLSVLAAWQADYHVPLILPREGTRECLERLLACLEENGREWDYLELVAPGPETAVVQALRAWATGERRFFETDLSPSPYIDLDGASPLEGLIPWKRKHLRKDRRRLEAQGKLDAEVFDQPRDMVRALELYLGVERRSWKKAAGIGVGKDDRNEAFFRELLPRLAARGRAVVSFLKQGDRLLAGGIQLRMGDTVWGLQCAYDLAYSRFSPGNLQRTQCLEREAARGARRYELLAEELEGKLQLTRTVRPNLRVRVLQVKGLRRMAVFLPALVKMAFGRRLLTALRLRPRSGLRR